MQRAREGVEEHLVDADLEAALVVGGARREQLRVAELGARRAQPLRHLSVHRVERRRVLVDALRRVARPPAARRQRAAARAARRRERTRACSRTGTPRRGRARRRRRPPPVPPSARTNASARHMRTRFETVDAAARSAVALSTSAASSSATCMSTARVASSAPSTRAGSPPRRSRMKAEGGLLPRSSGRPDPVRTPPSRRRRRRRRRPAVGRRSGATMRLRNSSAGRGVRAAAPSPLPPASRRWRRQRWCRRRGRRPPGGARRARARAWRSIPMMNGVGVWLISVAGRGGGTPAGRG